MLTKSRTLALGVVVAGAIGFGAPLASAATLPGSGAVTSTSTSATTLMKSLGCTQVVPGSSLAGSGAVVNVLSGTATTLKGTETIVRGLLGGAGASTVPAGTTCGMVVEQLKTMCAEYKSAGPASAAAAVAASHGLSVGQVQALCDGNMPTGIVPTNIVPTTTVPTSLTPTSVVPASVVPATGMPSLPGVSNLTDPFSQFGGLSQVG